MQRVILSDKITVGPAVPGNLADPWNGPRVFALSSCPNR
jgi:hypothetical protein